MKIQIRTGLESQESDITDNLEQAPRRGAVSNLRRYEPAVFGKHLIPKTSEQYYYRKLFEEYYSGSANIVPYYCMPKYVDATDV